MSKLQTSVRLSEKAKGLIAKLAEAVGVTQSGILEMAIREMATRRGVK